MWDLGPDVPERWGGGRLSGLLARAGGGAEDLACIVPGREPCFLLSALPDGGRSRGGLPSSPRVWKAGERPTEAKDHKAAETCGPGTQAAGGSQEDRPRRRFLIRAFRRRPR